MSATSMSPATATTSPIPTVPTHGGGPQTAQGKASSSRNALTHGLRSASPVLPELEREEDWKAYRAGVFRSLAPVGDLETALAERIALTLWRLRRVARYEAATAGSFGPPLSSGPRHAADPPPSSERNYFVEELRSQSKRLDRVRRHLYLLEALRSIEDDTPISKDDAAVIVDGNLLLPGYVPLIYMRLPFIPLEVSPLTFDQWTAGGVRQALTIAAESNGHTLDDYLPIMASHARKLIQQFDADVCQREAYLEERDRREHDARRQREEQTRHARLLPPADVLDRVVRYEAHLNRQLAAALQQLHAWQSRRLGPDTPPPHLESLP